MIKTLLKALGVEVTDDTIKKLEILLPQLPNKVNEVIGVINERMQLWEARVTTLETQNTLLLQKVEELLTHVHNSHADTIGRIELIGNAVANGDNNRTTNNRGTGKRSTAA